MESQDLTYSIYVNEDTSQSDFPIYYLEISKQVEIYNCWISSAKPKYKR